MTRRDLLVVALLTIVTCGLYSFYWSYKTTDELKSVTGKELNPGLELLLSIITCGIFSIYIHYRNAQLVTERMKALSGSYDDKAALVLGLDVASLFLGVTYLVAMLILQDELNKLANALSAGGVATVDANRVGWRPADGAALNAGRHVACAFGRADLRLSLRSPRLGEITLPPWPRSTPSRPARSSPLVEFPTTRSR